MDWAKLFRAIVQAVVKAAPVLIAYLAGKGSEQKRAAVHAAKVKQDQLEALHDAPHSKEELQDRLRKGGAL